MKIDGGFINYLGIEEAMAKNEGERRVKDYSLF